MIATRGVRLELLPSGNLRLEDSVLAAISFGAPHGSVSPERTEVRVPMPPLGDSPLVEVWRTNDPVERSTRGDFSISCSGDTLFGATVASETGGLRDRAASIYQGAIRVAREAGYPNIVRMWNHFPEIHRPEDGIERYQVFCAGRADGFEHSGYALGHDLPAASGVGTAGDGLLVMFIATTGDVRHVENPRQVSAFRYPRRYGPRSPSFARASIAALGGERQLFVSGTASIVGCESVHAGDLELQFKETVENLRTVCEVASDGKYRTLRDLPSAVYRAYVRHPGDFEPLQSMFSEAVDPDARSIWVRGDICREELLLEIEMWTRL